MVGDKNDTRHQCRWCSELTTGNGIYCAVKKKTLSESSTKRVNKCKYFQFVNIDAYDLTSEYKPRLRYEKQVKGQMRLNGL